MLKQVALGLAACGLTIVWSAAAAYADAPTLVGLDTNKPMTIPLSVQAAYNDTQMFFNIEWQGNRGDTHDLVHFTNGAWQKEGGSRREAQSTLDNDPSRGPTDLNSTNYESRISWMLNDPSGPNAVPGFSQTGCFSTCHDNSRGMPEWDPSQDLTKYLNKNPLNPNGEGQLDLWHHRQARSNPIGMSDDQKVIVTDGTVGGRKGDGGNGAPYQTNKIITDGLGSHPTWVLDPNTTTVGGKYAFAFQDVHTDPDHNFMRAGDSPPVSIAEAMDYADAVAQGYVPTEGDTVPRRRLRDLRGTTRVDITAVGSSFTPIANPDFDTDHYGKYESNTQRLLDTLDPDDTALADGNTYDIAFGLHTGMVNMRDHYVSFPMKLSLGAGNADIVAQKLDGDAQPDWSQIGESDLELFLPGITSLDFLLNLDKDKEILDPNTGQLVESMHGGAGGLLGGATCKNCHTTSGPNSSSFGGSMENRVPDRGGVWTPTPLRVPEPATLVLLTLTGVIGLAVAARRRKQK